MSYALFVFVAGPSGVGKTTSAQLLVEELNEAGIEARLFSMDRYYKKKTDRTAGVGFDVPRAYDLKLYYEHLKQLNDGNSIESPQYCFKEGDRLAETIPIDAEDVQVFVVEGILALHEVSKLPVDNILPIFITADSYLTIIKQRVKRDAKEERTPIFKETEKKTEPERTIAEFKDVNDGYFNYILPSKREAELVITNNPIPLTTEEEQIVSDNDPAEGNKLLTTALQKTIKAEVMPLIEERLALLSYRNCFS